jgi:hypothetical protein
MKNCRRQTTKLHSGEMNNYNRQLLTAHACQNSRNETTWWIIYTVTSKITLKLYFALICFLHPNVYNTSMSYTCQLQIYSPTPVKKSKRRVERILSKTSKISLHWFTKYFFSVTSTKVVELNSIFYAECKYVLSFLYHARFLSGIEL